MPEATDRLGSWTRTLNEEDALALLDLARPGMPVAEWAELGHALLPQASLPRRRELIRIVRDELLDTADGCVADSAWLRLFHDGSPHRRLGLLYGRLWWNRPLVQRALDALVLPTLERCDRPLAPHDADLVDLEAWDRFLHATVGDLPAEAFAKTRSTVQGALREVGVLAIEPKRRVTRVRRGRPDALAFAWLLAHELRGRGEATDGWATRESFAARLFAPTVDYAATCVEAGVSAGLLRRSHLMATSRLHAGPEMG